MTTDIEQELRDLFREKAGEVPVATPAAATQQVLRRGRRRQVGTVLGSALVAVALAVASFAGLRSLLQSDTDPFQTGLEPSNVTEPRGEMVELSGTFLDQTWTARFTGAFADETACIRVIVDGKGDEPICPKPPGTSPAGDHPSFLVVNTAHLAVVVASVPPDVVEIRFTSERGSNTPSEFQCRRGPAGWTDPDRKVCASALPAKDSGIFEYLDSNGRVLFQEGIGWGAAAPAVAEPVPVDPVHGGTYWGVYPWLSVGSAPEANDVVAQLFDDYGIQASQGDLACDQGAAEALATDATWRVAVYFQTEEDANAFALQEGLLDHEERVIARVTTLCLD